VIIKYKVNYGNATIEKAFVVRETGNSIYVPVFGGSRRVNKVTSYHCYLDTFEEAKKHLIGQSRINLAEAEESVKKELARQKKIEALTVAL